MNRLPLFLAASLLAGCPSDPPVEPEPTPGPFLGQDPAVAAAPGEARAGVVREGPAGEAALFGGINAEGRAGDIKLYNDRVQFIVQAGDRRHGLVDVGGGLLDADLVRPVGQLGRDTLEDGFFAFALARVVHSTSVEIISDGSDGGSAIVRSTGTDIPWDFMTGLFELPEPNLPDLGLTVVQEFELPPDSYALTLRATLTNSGAEAVTFAPRDGLMSSGEDLLPWSPGEGLRGPASGDLSAMGLTGRRGEATMSLWPAQGTIQNSGLGALAAGLGIVTLTHAEITLEPGASHTWERVFAVTPDMLTAEGLRWEQQGVALEAVAGRVTDAAGGVAGARVWIVEDGTDSVAGFALTDADGAWAASLPAGDWVAWAMAQADEEHPQLPLGAGRTGAFAAPSLNDAQRAALSGESTPSAPLWAVGRAPSAATSFSLPSAEPVDLGMQAASGVRLLIEDGTGSALPGVVDVRWADNQPAASDIPPSLHDALGHPGGSRALWGWTATGVLDAPLAPGDYSIRVGHSWRHGQDLLADVHVEAGAITEVTATLPEVILRDGWLSLDSHLHAAPSFDGALSMEHRLVTCAATGLDLPVMTDHDRQVDYAPLAQAMGLNQQMQVLPGVEVTSLLRGHFNLFPVTPDPAQPNGGAEPWWQLPTDTQELFDRMRARAGADAITQVNHPRTPGMFSLARFQAQTAEALSPDLWSWDFDIFELLNGGVTNLPQVRDDWFAMLSVGTVRVPMGSSDSHYAYIPCGHGRTDVWLDSDDPAAVTVDAVREAILAGRIVVAGGTTLRATLDVGAGEVGPGSTTNGTAGALSITVQAPDWISPGTLKVWQNWELVYEQDLDAPNGATWFDGEVPVQVDVDAWIAVEVEGTESIGPLWRDFTPYAMTNAFFVDVAGDGWEAPGLGDR
jgi:hypothetical protein